MMWKSLITAGLGLLLITGTSLAEKRMTISPRQGPDEDAPREHVASQHSGASSKGVSRDRSETSYLEPIQVTGTLRSSRGRGLSINGEAVTLGANCGIFPVSDPGRLPHPSTWRGRKVTIFGYRTRAGIDARLLILQDGSHKSGRGSLDANMIPSSTDPTVGVQRRGTPG